MVDRPRLGFAVEYVADIETARRFYSEVLGLEIERVHLTFVQFKDPGGARFAISSEEPLGGRDERELYWLVDDAEAAFHELASKAEVSLPLQQMPFGKVFGVVGPAGQPHYLLEFARERPSRSV